MQVLMVKISRKITIHVEDDLSLTGFLVHPLSGKEQTSTQKCPIVVSWLISPPRGANISNIDHDHPSSKSTNLHQQSGEKSPYRYGLIPQTDFHGFPLTAIDFQLTLLNHEIHGETHQETHANPWKNP